MPQASDEDRDRYRKMFGDIGPEHAMQALEERGYKLTKDWDWIPPKDHAPTAGEIFMMSFLFAEWDFGGLASDEGSEGL